MAKLTDLLVVSDLDGTLLQAGYGIPKNNIEAVERFVKKGGKFTVCTGRSKESVRRYIDWLPLTAPAILNNGALIYDYKKEKVLFSDFLDRRATELVRQIAELFPDLGIEFHNAEGITTARQSEQSHYHTSIEHIPYTLTDIEHIKGDWNKVLFAAPEERIKQLEKHVEKRARADELYSLFDFVRSTDIYFEVVPKGTNKGTGLKALAKLLKIDMKNTVAIGDYYNDLEMLKVAGYRAVVADAPADIRALADVTVSGCLQGGVGELLDSLESLCDGFEQLKLEL